MRDCKRCGGEVSWTEDTTTLFGGVVVHLCNGCRTEWHERLMKSPAWEKTLEWQARFNHYVGLSKSGQPVGESKWLEITREENAAKSEAYALGLAFVAERVGAKAVPAEANDETY